MMSILNNKTEKKALQILADALKHFERLTPVYLNTEDADRITAAEHTLRMVIEKNSYLVIHRIGQGMKLIKIKSQR